MDEQIVTECPGCHARFRVSAEQLKSSKGRVRCGACLMVFAVAENKPTAPSRPSTSAAAPSRAAKSQPATQRAKPAAQRLAQTAAKVASQPAKQTAPSKAPPQKRKVAKKPPVEASTNTGATELLMDGLHAEPISIGERHPEDHALAKAGWMFLGAVALIVLVLQLAWFERATQGKTPALTPLYNYACQYVSCNLDSRSSSLIKNKQLIIRPHPQFADAIIADIQLENDAAFAQPYPALTLIFSDLQGSLVSRRTFQPEDYLDPSLNPDTMPAGVPVEIHMQMTDPGPQAVSYRLEIQPASKR